ncbi:MAG TPA: 50S ribosomal protein L14 [Elusimicrobia bacterium]|jgi:large subunit ribosomal protein L14|nr:50S ribosomal protein L14 [Elusimicrobiota bacterium]
MIQERTIINVCDNSGVRKIRCFRVLGGTKRHYASLGDVIIASVREALPTATIKKGEVIRAVIVRVVKEKRRHDGSYVKFDDNAGVIVDDQGEPKGTRIFGPVARELRERNFLKIVSLAPEVV